MKRDNTRYVGGHLPPETYLQLAEALFYSNKTRQQFIEEAARREIETYRDKKIVRTMPIYPVFVPVPPPSLPEPTEDEFRPKPCIVCRTATASPGSIYCSKCSKRMGGAGK